MTESNLCIFHKESAHLSAKENEQKQNHLDQKIKSNLSQKKPLLLIGYNINDLRFEGEFPTSIYLLNSKINKVDFSNAVFKGVVDFEEALFNIDVNFANAVFKSVTSFIASRFEGEIAIFSKVTFEDAVMFQEAIFNGVAYFNQAFFKGYPNFSRTIFRGRKENFTAPTIKGELPDFSMLLEAGLPKYVGAIFRKATFQEGADFGESHFKGEASFFEPHLEVMEFTSLMPNLKN